MPKIIISHVIVAAAALRRECVAVANRASSDVPDQGLVAKLCHFFG